MYYRVPRECSGEEFRVKITEGRETNTVIIPAVIQTLVKGIALEYIVHLQLGRKEQAMLMYLIDRGKLKNNETIGVMSSKTGFSKVSVINSLQNLSKAGLVIRNRYVGDRTDLTPFVERMLRFKKLYDLYAWELDKLMKYFGNEYGDPTLALQEVISKLFSITPEPPLARFLRVCLLNGFDEGSLKEETVKTIRTIVSSEELDEVGLLLGVFFSGKSWEKTIAHYNDRDLPMNEEFVQSMYGVINKVERLIQSPKQVVDGLVGEGEEFYKQMGKLFPDMEYEEMRESERLEKVARVLEETEDRVQVLLDRFVL